jgi:hypothetical protein
MRDPRLHRLVLPAALAGTLATAAPRAQQAPVFRTAVDTVRIYATVRDEHRLMPGLGRDDFIVLDNGRQVAITQFANTPQPITAVLMLDMSVSPHLWHMRRFALAFASTFHAADRVRIGSFSGVRIAISPTWTRDPEHLERILREELWPAAGTPLWNAIDAAMTAMAGEDGRRVVIAITAGRNTTSVPGFGGGHGDVRTRAASEDVMVYAIGLPDPRPDLKRLADESGGGWLELSTAADVEQLARDVAAELHHQYLIGFAPIERDGRIHTIEVRTSDPRFDVRARTQYLAPRGR